MRFVLGAVFFAGVACAPTDREDVESEAAAEPADIGPVDGAIPQSEVVAIVDGHVIAKAEVRHAIEGTSPLLRQRFETPEGRRAFLSSLVDRQLIVAEGRRRGLHDAPGIRRKVRAFEERLVAQALVAERQPAAPDDAALTRYFESHREDFEIAAAVDVGRIALLWGPSAGPAARAEVRERAAALRARLLGGEPFARVATEGHGPERRRGGRLGCLARGAFDAAELEAAAFSIGEVGGLSPLVETDSGVHLFVLLDRRSARQPDLPEVRGAVIARYRKHEERAALDDLARSLRRDAEIELRPKNLEAP